MSFLDAVNAGLEKARQTRIAVNEVSAVFSQMNSELKSFERAKLEVKRGISMAAGMMAAVSFTLSPGHELKQDSEYVTEDILNLYVTLHDGKTIKKRIAGWRQNINGYPCTLDFEGQAVVCHTAENLRASLQELLGSSTFGQALAEALNG